jgi:hypothetical protein
MKRLGTEHGDKMVDNVALYSGIPGSYSVREMSADSLSPLERFRNTTLK